MAFIFCILLERRHLFNVIFIYSVCILHHVLDPIPFPITLYYLSTSVPLQIKQNLKEKEKTERKPNKLF